MKNGKEDLVSAISPIDEKVIELQRKFDEAFDNQNVDILISTIEDAKTILDTTSLNSISIAALYYSIATTYSDLQFFSEKFQNENTQDTIVFYFRKSIDCLNEADKADLDNSYRQGLKLNLFTNYANTLNRNGRTIEALQYYQKALDINPDFAMAEGNCGIAFTTYANETFIPQHKELLNYVAYTLLKSSLSKKNQLHPSASKQFERYLSIYDPDDMERLEKEINFTDCQLGDTEEEKNYREWLLYNRLYLNAMNDLPFLEKSMATDVLHLPSMLMNKSEGLEYKYHSMFNELKQEFISARYNFYESSQLERPPHFADKNTHLVNTLDYTQHSLRLERLKLSYRSLYSLFDKVAYFLNEYFGLGIKERDITFRSIWNSEKKGKRGYKYKNVLQYDKNHPLKAIYWLFKDLYVKTYKSPSPHAKKLNTIRNALEHKYVKVYSSDFSEGIDIKNESNLFAISEDILEEYTLQLLKMVRELLIYLSLSVHIHEQQSYYATEESYPSIHLQQVEDDWKY